MDPRILDLIASVIERCEGPGEPGPGHPPAETVRVVATLRRFLREGTPWRSLRATSAQASGSTLRRRLADWAAINLLQRVHALLVAMLRGDPDLILDSCSVRAKRGGDLVGPNPTDRGKRGTEYQIATTGDGVPVACAATAANVNDTVLFERLFLTAFAVVAKIGTVLADKGGACPAARKAGPEGRRGQPRDLPGVRARTLPAQAGPSTRLGSGQAALAGRAEQRPAAGKQAARLRYDRIGFIMQALLQPACLFLIAGRLAREL